MDSFPFFLNANNKNELETKFILKHVDKEKKQSLMSFQR